MTRWKVNSFILLVGAYWGCFLTSLFSLVGELRDPVTAGEVYTTLGAFSVLLFVIVQIFVGFVTVVILIEPQE